MYIYTYICVYIYAYIDFTTYFTTGKADVDEINRALLDVNGQLNLKASMADISATLHEQAHIYILYIYIYVCVYILHNGQLNLNASMADISATLHEQAHTIYS